MADKIYKITFELSDGTERSVEFTAPQGEQGIQGEPGAKGDKGDTGAQGIQGEKGDKGDPGEKGEKGDTGEQGIQGEKGDKGDTGETGATGADGKTPVKGVDYWTEEDQESIVQQVIAALGTPVFGTVDADNNIILTGALGDGTYTLKYEDAEGNVTEIGTLEQGASYTNLADPSSADWLTNQRLNSSGVVTDTTPSLTTNYIPVQMGDTVRVRYVDIRFQGSGTNNATTHFYDANKNRVASLTPGTVSQDYVTLDADGLGYTFNMTTVSEKFTVVSGASINNICYARFVGRLFDGYTKDDVIITVNEEITE